MRRELLRLVRVRAERVENGREDLAVAAIEGPAEDVPREVGVLLLVVRDPIERRRGATRPSEEGF